jgi:hypothetical protein
MSYVLTVVACIKCYMEYQTLPRFVLSVISNCCWRNKIKIIKHAENVYEIEEFLTIEEQQLFLSSCTDDGWELSHPGNIVKKMTLEQRKLSLEIRIRLSRFFDNLDSLTIVNRLRRLIKDEFMHPHKDDGDPLNKKVVVFGIGIYLNNDFSGGELHYPDLSLSISPRPRSAVIHYGQINHEVKTVKSGARYSITVFAFGDNTTRFNGHI